MIRFCCIGSLTSTTAAQVRTSPGRHARGTAVAAQLCAISRTKAATLATVITVLAATSGSTAQGIISTAANGG